METYDDRPVSVYDNLNMSSTLQTSTPKYQRPPATTATAATAAVNGNVTQSPYTDISFKFDDTKKEQQANGNLNLGPEQPVSLINSSMSMNTPYYSTPIKPSLQATQLQNGNNYNSNNNNGNKLNNNHSAGINHKSALATPTPRQTYDQVANSPPVKATSTSISTAAAAATSPLTANAIVIENAPVTTPENAFQLARPLSQHSQSDLNESIAAVKAALYDAKSKFFGLNDYSTKPSTPIAPLINNSSQSPVNSASESLANAPVDILRLQTPPKPHQQQQPKYQNIPENSAIFRSQQPPELPPKPSHLSSSSYANTPNAKSTNSTLISTPSTSPDRIPNTTTPNHSDMTLATSSFMHPSNGNDPNASSSTSKLLPNATYKQLPLNDIDKSHPSQVVYMSTTVPQNIKGSKIAGRHTPTRNSLRHSRMLVVNNKNYQGPDYPNPLNLKRQILAIWLLILQILIGTFLLCLALWIILLAPNTPIQDNPYWSGLALVMAGILGLSIIRFQRIKRRRFREHCFKFLMVNAHCIVFAAAVLCTIAGICAVVHFVRLNASDTKCAPTNVLLEHGSCTCSFHTVGTAADGEEPTKSEDQANASYSYEYRDLSCDELSSKWHTILAASIGLNWLGMLVAVMYISMLVCCQYKAKRYYSSVQTSTF